MKLPLKMRCVALAFLKTGSENAQWQLSTAKETHEKEYRKGKEGVLEEQV